MTNKHRGQDFKEATSKSMRMWLELEVVVTGLPLLIRPLYIRQNYLALLGIFSNTIYHQIYNNESNIYFFNHRGLIVGFLLKKSFKKSNLCTYVCDSPYGLKFQIYIDIEYICIEIFNRYAWLLVPNN